MQAENAYLRDENADLRRQLYAFRVSQPYNPGQPPPGGPQGPLHMDSKPWDDVKPEHGDGNGYPYGGGGGGPGGMQGPPGGMPGSGSGQAPQMSPRVSVQERVSLVSAGAPESEPDAWLCLY